MKLRDETIFDLVDLRFAKSEKKEEREKIFRETCTK